jgi:threonine aldolase
MAHAIVDLRSDTVTRPTPEMRRAMADAEVGDDVYGEDPTVNALQDAFAERVGKDAALFVPSGTMGNQLALRLLARPATTVIAGARQHVVIYENVAAGVNSPVQFHTVYDTDGTVAVDEIDWAVDAAAHHWPTPSVVCVEDTHMPSGGRVWPVERLRAAGDAARRAGLSVHLDGARLFHAEVASGVSVAERAACATTVMCCLSKGLCAPVGSMLAGPADVMAEARAARQRLGGGMRQAGVIAAAGLVALRQMVERLADDHARARTLAEAVAERWPSSGCDPATVETNVVVFEHPEPGALLAHLESEGVRAGTIAPGVVRFVTHHDVDDDDIAHAVKALATAP